MNWLGKSDVTGKSISHNDAKVMDNGYSGKRGVVGYDNDDIRVFADRNNAGISATVRGTDIHNRTMKVDYVRDEPRSYQARYIKDISADGFVAEFVVPSGRIDAFYCDGKTAHIVDFKSGAFGDFSEQMAKYVNDIRHMFPKVKIMTYVIYTDQWETEVSSH